MKAILGMYPEPSRLTKFPIFTSLLSLQVKEFPTAYMSAADLPRLLTEGAFLSRLNRCYVARLSPRRRKKKAPNLSFFPLLA